ncbi:MAG: hypothetical protein JSU04_16155 [Bdellovibrionales bacterium]|nr:hypothetical protein [Bdellovibrionales bacterium]
MKFLALLMTFVVCVSFARAETVTGEGYEQKTNFGKKLFDLDIKVDRAEGLTKTTAIYKDLKGQPTVEEKGVVKGDELISFDVDQRQIREKGHIEVQGDRVFFTYEKDGKKKTAEEKLKKPFLTPANFNLYVSNHWADFAGGKEVEVRFAVWFRLETVGFKIFKVGETLKGSQKLIQLRMKPSSFVIAALVDPLNLWYTEDGQKLMELSGRVSTMLPQGDDFKDLDADVRYIHHN